jgi:Sensory domain found in PocR
MRPVQHWQPALRGAPNENPFCELMARSNCVCAACLEVQRKLTEKIGARSRAVTCFAGLSDSAVPIRIGDQLSSVSCRPDRSFLSSRPNSVSTARPNN